MPAQFISTLTDTLVATTAKIPMEIAPASSKDAQIIMLDITFDTVFSVTYPKVEFCTYGTVGSGGSTPTPVKYGENQNTAANTVIRTLDTSAPTTITPIWTWYWSAAYLWPLGENFELLASGKYCIRLTSPAASNYAINLIFAE